MEALRSIIFVILDIVDDSSHYVIFSVIFMMFWVHKQA